MNIDCSLVVFYMGHASCLRRSDVREEKILQLSLKLATAINNIIVKALKLSTLNSEIVTDHIKCICVSMAVNTHQLEQRVITEPLFLFPQNFLTH